MALTTGRDLKGKSTKVNFKNLEEPQTIKFNLNALYFLEKQYGDINKALSEVQGGKIQSLIAITTAALNAGKSRKKEWTENEVAEIIEVEDLADLAEALKDMMGSNNATPSEPELK